MPAKNLDPVDVLQLPGDLIATLPCPFMSPGPRRPLWRRATACGQMAMLYRYPDPYGLRSRCEEGHVVVLHEHSVPGWAPLRGRTD